MISIWKAAVESYIYFKKKKKAYINWVLVLSHLGGTATEFKKWDESKW